MQLEFAMQIAVTALGSCAFTACMCARLFVCAFYLCARVCVRAFLCEYVRMCAFVCADEFAIWCAACIVVPSPPAASCGPRRSRYMPCQFCPAPVAPCRSYRHPLSPPPPPPRRHRRAAVSSEGNGKKESKAALLTKSASMH